MKREIALAGIALVVSILLSSPSLAQTPQITTNAAPAPAPIEAVAVVPAEELSIDDAILMASTPEERAAVLRRCAGPPPRFMPPIAAELPAAEPPASEPAVVADE